jgi:Spy/CpxP family protein refolding chaperone
MRSSIAQLIIGTAVAMSVVGVSASGSAVAHSPVGQAQVIGQEALTNRYGSPFSETDLRLSDRQQLRGYFLDGSRERFR